MAHSVCEFGIVISRGGFTTGAIDFARGKPILFLDVSDLIAMQEGQDVLAGSTRAHESSRTFRGHQCRYRPRAQLQVRPASENSGICWQPPGYVSYLRSRMGHHRVTV